MKATSWKLEPQQASALSLREWQRYRGWTLKILGVLEHSGGMTTRMIADATDCRCRTAGTILCRMVTAGLVERIEKWGYRITRDGIVLILNTTTTTTTTICQQNVNTTSTQCQHLSVPLCFYTATCHIKRNCELKEYNKRNATLCDLCVWKKPEPWQRVKIPQEIQVRG